MVGTNETPGFVRAELDRSDALIRATGYEGPITFRPPYGKKLLMLPWELSRRGVPTVTLGRRARRLHAGDARGIERLRADGYRFVTVRELLALR